MRRTYVTLSAVAFSALTSMLIANQARAATMAQAGSGVQAYFGSQGTVYTAADPTAAFTPAGAPGVTGYPVGAPLPNLPAPVVPGPTPATPTPNPFQPSPWLSTFNDGFGAPTIAKSVIGDNYNPSPTITSDASIAIPFWNLTQANTAPSYAYEQLDFVANYTVTGGTLGAFAPSLPIAVSGSVVGGATDFAQFDAMIQYTWYDVNAAGVVGAMTPLGTLNYTFLQPGGGAFSTTITSTGSLIATPTPSGILELTGYMWVAGDPVDINVESVPEPASIGLLAIGAMAILRKRRGGMATRR